MKLPNIIKQALWRNRLKNPPIVEVIKDRLAEAQEFDYNPAGPVKAPTVNRKSNAAAMGITYDSYLRMRSSNLILSFLAMTPGQRKDYRREIRKHYLTMRKTGVTIPAMM